MKILILWCAIFFPISQWKLNQIYIGIILFLHAAVIQLQLQTSETEITKSEKDLPSLHGNSFGGVKVIPNKPIAIFLLKIYNNKDCNLFTLFFLIFRSGTFSLIFQNSFFSFIVSKKKWLARGAILAGPPGQAWVTKWVKNLQKVQFANKLCLTSNFCKINFTISH